MLAGWLALGPRPFSPWPHNPYYPPPITIPERDDGTTHRKIRKREAKDETHSENKGEKMSRPAEENDDDGTTDQRATDTGLERRLKNDCCETHGME